MAGRINRVTILKQGYADGLSGGQIADQLGGVTRNAVIGKANRSGIVKNKRKYTSKKPKAKAAKRNGFRPDHKGSKPPLVLAPLPEMDIPMEQRRTLS